MTFVVFGLRDVVTGGSERIVLVVVLVGAAVNLNIQWIPIIKPDASISRPNSLIGKLSFFSRSSFRATDQQRILDDPYLGVRNWGREESPGSWRCPLLCNHREQPWQRRTKWTPSRATAATAVAGAAAATAAATTVATISKVNQQETGTPNSIEPNRCNEPIYASH